MENQNTKAMELFNMINQNYGLEMEIEETNVDYMETSDGEQLMTQIIAYCPQGVEYTFEYCDAHGVNCYDQDGNYFNV